MKKSQKKKLMKLFLSLVAMTVVTVVGYLKSDVEENENNEILANPIIQEVSFNLEEVPEFDGNRAYVVINNNIPNFEEQDLLTESFEKYSDLDNLGRCGVAYANIGIDIMPTEEREAIGQVKPTGWHTVRYDCVENDMKIIGELTSKLRDLGYTCTLTVFTPNKKFANTRVKLHINWE